MRLTAIEAEHNQLEMETVVLPLQARPEFPFHFWLRSTLLRVAESSFNSIAMLIGDACNDLIVNAQN